MSDEQPKTVSVSTTTPNDETKTTATVSWSEGFTALQRFYMQAGAVGLVCMLLVWTLYTHRQDMNETLNAQRADAKNFIVELKEIQNRDREIRVKTNEAIREHQKSVELTHQALAKVMEKILDMLTRWDLIAIRHQRPMSSNTERSDEKR